jgi:ferredoxin
VAHLEIPEISIDDDLCSKDGLCAQICPMRIFSLREVEPPAVGRMQECVLCGQCLSACPRNAIRHSRLPRGHLRRIDSRRPSTIELAVELLSERRSVRAYRKESPPKELLSQILQIAGYAPSNPFHRIGWVREFVVLSGEQNMAQAREITADYMRRVRKLLSGSMVRLLAKVSPAAKAGLEVLPDLTMRLEELDKGRDAITYEAPVAVFAIAPLCSATPQVDCDAAMFSVMLLAHAHGLGTCWNGLLQSAAAGEHLRGFKSLAELLKIPKGYRCYAAATIGYPATKLHSVPHREVSTSWILAGGPSAG